MLAIFRRAYLVELALLHRLAREIDMK